MKVAEMIIKQLGGIGRLQAMIGAKDFVGGPDKVQFKWKAKAANKANCLVVKLTPADEYEVEFWKIRGFKMDKVSEHPAFAGTLKELFERETGLYLSL